MRQFDSAARAGAAWALSLEWRRWFVRGRDYLARHWRGELALPYASVINGLVLGAVSVSMAAALGDPLNRAAQPAVAALGLIALWAAIAAVTMWQVVGVWRAADRHARSGGRLAASGALTAVLLGVLVGAGVFLRAGLPQIVEASQFALGKDPIGDVAMRVTSDGTVLEIDGPIVFGVTERVQALLAEHRAVAAVRLTSPGGRVVEARELRDLIRERGMTTVATGNCASACTVAFMAGRERLLAPGGNLGFHRYRSPALGESEAEASMAIDKRDLGARGVPGWFLERAFATPHNEMWRPTFAELHIANVVTGRLGPDGARIAASADRESLERALRQRPLYAALRAYEPQAFEQALDAIEQGGRDGVPMQAVDGRVRSIVAGVIAKRAPFASDEAVVAFAAAAAKTLRALRSHSADACYRYLGASAETDLAAVPTEVRERETAAIAVVIESAAAAGAPDPAVPAGAEAAYAAIAPATDDAVGMLVRADASAEDRSAACATALAQYEGALALPAPRRAQQLRRLLAAR